MADNTNSQGLKLKELELKWFFKHHHVHYILMFPREGLIWWQSLLHSNILSCKWCSHMFPFFFCSHVCIFHQSVSTVVIQHLMFMLSSEFYYCSHRTCPYCCILSFINFSCSVSTFWSCLVSWSLFCLNTLSSHTETFLVQIFKWPKHILRLADFVWGV